MAFLRTSLLVLVLILFCSTQFLEARKLFDIQKTEFSPLESSLVFSTLEKGPTPPSNPSDKGHGTPPSNPSDKGYARSGSLVFSTLEKGPTPPSNPSDKGHGTPPSNPSDKGYARSGNLVFSALVKGPTPPSSPSDKGHSTPPLHPSDKGHARSILTNRKDLTALPTHVDRILGSVPSPGTGN